ncbi:MAG: hypothetical protein ABIV43_03325 [Candidatus Saccharimonadales bacterium]
MASNGSLSTTTNNGGAQPTNNPGLQAPAGTGGFDGGTPSTIQPVISGSSLDSTSGVPLVPNSLANSTIPLRSTGVQTATASLPPRHQVHPAMVTFSLILFVLAIGLFWYTGHVEKNTTQK